jgi:alkanesulfonate monooxygenase SsuD/methylene tetrahydromethanopterin reductase-like flavin-dependent oxidoreductase (luciferase family)
MEVYVYSPALHTPEDVPAVAKMIEGLGYDGIAMPDHLYVPNFNTGEPNPYAHGPSTLTACAVATEQIRLVQLVASNLVRNPVELAHSVATLFRLSGGRSEMGIGTGWFRPQYEAMGIGFPRGGERIGRMVEAVQICRALFQDGQCDFDGKYYSAHIPKGGFIPVEGTIRILVGAAGPRSIRAAARVADRVDFQPDSLQTGTVELPKYNSYTFEQLKAGVETVREVAGSMGREVTLSESPFVFVTEDAAAGSAQREGMADFLGIDRDLMDRSLGSIIGSAEEVAERLTQYAKAGCDRVHLQSLHPEVAERLAPFVSQLQAL